MRYLVTSILAVCLVFPAAAHAGDDAPPAGPLARIIAALAGNCGSDVSGDANTITNTSYEVENDGRVVNTGDIIINITIGDIEFTSGDDDDEPTPFAWSHGSMPTQWMNGGAFGGWGRGSERGGAMDEAARQRIHSAMQDVDPEFMQFMFRVGRLAHAKPEFRERLAALLAEFED